jgi:hypothetical protein
VTTPDLSCLLIIMIHIESDLKAWVCGRSLGGIVGSNPTDGTGVCCEFCMLSGRGLCVSLVTRLEVLCLECNREASILRRPWPTRGCHRDMGKTLRKTQREKKYFCLSLFLRTKIQIGFHAGSDCV